MKVRDKIEWIRLIMEHRIANKDVNSHDCGGPTESPHRAGQADSVKRCCNPILGVIDLSKSDSIQFDNE